MYREQGVRTVLVTATRGDKGKPGDPPLCERDQLPIVREAELRRAAEIIGIDAVHVLDYRDQELAAAPRDQIRAELVGFIRQYRPDIVLTFDPNGFNAHPDHIAISRFASEAIGAASDPRWHPEAGRPHAVTRLLWTPPIPPWESARAADLPAHPGIDFILDISPWRDVKAHALRTHRTQHLPIDRYFFSQPDVANILSVETYRHAWGPPLSGRPVSDIFDGM